jgi:hypothetical protein
MPEYLYRFRSTAALLGTHNELEAQEIYFCPPSQLNDPMEGFRDIFWKGDVVLWRNLLRHYARCLTVSVSMGMMLGELFTAEAAFDMAYSADAHPPSDALKEKCLAAANAFVALPHVGEVASELGKRARPVRREELGFILRALHTDALRTALLAWLPEHGGLIEMLSALEKAQPAEPFSVTRILDALHPAEVANEIIFEASEHQARELRLIAALQREAHRTSDSTAFLMLDFPHAYVRSLERLMYPDWYTACFVADPANAAMWGVYGDSHKGVGLKFRAGGDPNNPTLSLHQAVGFGSSRNGDHREIYDYVAHRLSKVEYVEGYPETDFFSSIGRVTVGALRDQWHSDDVDGVSPVHERIMSSEEGWRESYWSAFGKNATIKTADWAHEKEYRAILSGVLIDFRDISKRKLKYRFSDLAGIYFGIHTSTADIAKIASIIQAKCKSENRRGFEFYQARYARRTGQMEFDRLALLEHALFGNAATQPLPQAPSAPT